jgi:hypothetical protein
MSAKAHPVEDRNRQVHQHPDREVCFAGVQGVVAEHDRGEMGAARAGGRRIAWYRDTYGNTFAVEADVWAPSTLAENLSFPQSPPPPESGVALERGFR